MKKILPMLRLLPFWLFILLFKFGGDMHFTPLAPLGERMFETWMVGLLIGGAALLQLILDVPAGLLLDRFGYIRMIRLGTLTFVGACLMLVFIGGPVGFILSLYVASLGWLFFGPGVNAYLLSIAPKEKAEKFMALRDVFDATGVFLSTLIIPFLVIASPKTIGLSGAAVLTFAFFMVLLAPKDKVSVHEEKKVHHHHFYIRRNAFKNLFTSLKRLNPASWLLITRGLSSSIFYAVIWFVLPIMMVDPSKKIFGISLGIFDLAIIALGTILGHLTKKTKHKFAVTGGLFIFALMVALLGHQTEWLFLLFGFIATAGDEFSNISLWSWLAKLDKDHESDGAVSGTISLFQDFGWMIGPILGGFLYGIVGPEMTISLGSIPIFITFVLALTLSSDEVETSERPHPRQLRNKR